MLDQSFSAKNFRKIFDYENRKGNYLERKFFPEIDEITKEIKKISGKIKQHHKTEQIPNSENYEETKERLYAEKQELKEKKEKLLLDKLTEISSSIVEENFLLGLKEIDIGKTKKAYGYQDNVTSYFALKQIQYNLRKLYKIKQGNRHNIVCQLRETLSDKLPKHVIRTDISSFYESIPRDILFKKLNDDPLLTFTSKKIIRRILHEYQELSGEGLGLPRGVSISAYLSELYLRKFDEAILRCPHVLYYARYVDDIIIVCTKDSKIGALRKLSYVKKELENIDLTLNREKTFIKILDHEAQETFEYLGYRFIFCNGNIKINFAKSKIEKYKNRIELSFNDYEKTVMSNKNKSKSLLIKRIRFLTGNTRLVNNKKNAVVGIYFSYNLINDMSYLRYLDCFLRKNINKINDTKLKTALLELSFEKGFNERRFFKFSDIDFKNIVKVWKYAT